MLAALKYNYFRALWAIQRDGYLKQKGFFRSFQEQSAVDAAGMPIPWMNYPFIDFLQLRLKPDFSVFEFGCGNSSLFWERHVNSVTGVEHDQGYVNYLKQRGIGGMTLLYAPDSEAYEQSIVTQNRKYDIIVIDGIRREECAVTALGALSERGVIILDDTLMEHLMPIFSIMEERCFRALSISGPKPIQNDISQTTIFYRNGNCLQI